MKLFELLIPPTYKNDNILLFQKFYKKLISSDKQTNKQTKEMSSMMRVRNYNKKMVNEMYIFHKNIKTRVNITKKQMIQELADDNVDMDKLYDDMVESKLICITDEIVNSKNYDTTRIKEINMIIKQQVCYDTIDKMSDEKMYETYKNSNSVKMKIKKATKRLEKYLDGVNLTKAVDEEIMDNIPAGTKSVYRGGLLNKIIENHIINMNFDPEKYEVAFEKVCDSCHTTEKPDFYILEKSTNKVIIGMNQIDLWTGGHQYNRGSKYIVDNKHNTEKSKLLCVVSKHIQLKSTKNKAFKFLDIVFKNDTLCYVNNLSNICKKFFESYKQNE